MSSARACTLIEGLMGHTHTHTCMPELPIKRSGTHSYTHTQVHALKLLMTIERLLQGIDKPDFASIKSLLIAVL